MDLLYRRRFYFVLFFIDDGKIGKYDAGKKKMPIVNYFDKKFIPLDLDRVQFLVRVEKKIFCVEFHQGRQVFDFFQGPRQGCYRSFSPSSSKFIGHLF